MKTIKERAKIYADKQCNCYKCDGIDNFTKQSCKKSLNNGCQEHRWKELGYIQGATEQKEIDREEMKQLRSIMEHTASVLGIGTKWFNEDARRDAILKLKQEIFDYLSD